MLVLFLNDGNGFESKDPNGDLIEFEEDIDIKSIQKLEASQLGARHTGGRLSEILEDLDGLKVKYKKLSHGRKSFYQSTKHYNEYTIYNLISGNY